MFSAIKKEIVLEIVGQAKKVLNYTHGWAIDKFNYLKDFTMASVHSIEEKIMNMIKVKPGLSYKAYMGLVMKEFRGKIEGQKVMEIIKKYIK